MCIFEGFVQKNSNLSFFKDIYDLFYPTHCLVCGSSVQDSQLICAACRHELPETHFCETPGNSMEKSLEGRVPVANAMALLYYKKGGAVQKLIHALKYKGKQEVGLFFARWMAAEMKQSKRWDTIDAIVMVPLHPKRLKSRGYNQLSLFSRELARELQIPWVKEVLVKTSNDQTQSHKGRTGRFEKIEERFHLTDRTKLSEKHVLLVDDVFTTGATVEACCNELLKSPEIQISIATMTISDY